jgi:hypothetical protein
MIPKPNTDRTLTLNTPLLDQIKFLNPCETLLYVILDSTDFIQAQAPQSHMKTSH